MVCFSLACLMARSTEFLMPAPRADRSPDKGAITPILATLAAPASPCGACSALLPQADIASDAASRVTPAITTLCLRTFPPGCSDMRGSAEQSREHCRTYDRCCVMTSTFCPVARSLHD